MSYFLPPRRSGPDAFLPPGELDSQLERLTPIAPRRARPPKVWGSIGLEDDQVVVRLDGWRSVVAMRRRLAVPLGSVTSVYHDPAVRAHVQAKLRRRASRTGLFRLGTYHSPQGWSFWSIGLARNALVIETSGARYGFVIVEVADPASTVDMIRKAAGLSSVGPDASRQEQSPP